MHSSEQQSVTPAGLVAAVYVSADAVVCVVAANSVLFHLVSLSCGHGKRKDLQGMFAA